MAEATATIDLDDPPVLPPDGCVDALLWELARKHYEQHRRTQGGECTTCPRWRHCAGPTLAKDGLATAMGERVKESAYWIAFAQLRAKEKARAA